MNIEKIFENNFENKEKKESSKIEETLELIQAKRKENKEILTDKSLENLPYDIQIKVKELKDKLVQWSVDYNIPQEKIDELIEREIEQSEMNYIDKRFEMPNKVFAKYQTQKSLDELLEQEPDPEELNKIAKLSFDLNGLKSVNDLNAGKHEYGDEYLRKVASVFKNEESDIRKELSEKNIKVLVSSEGGDEFGILLIGEKELTQDELTQIITAYNKEIALLEVGDLVDFNREEVLYTYASMSEQEWLVMGEEEKNKIITKVKEQVPHGFKFMASASGGGGTLFDALEKENINISEKDDYHRILEKLIGGLFDMSDKEMKNAKTEFKNTLRNSENPKERFLMDVYSRTEEQRELERINQELSTENSVIKKEIETLKKEIKI